eukprot:CAMPEP_0171319374 /NCGR_PEP_ID=MMETSP0816-20121228/96053_1 /TAXON_ID=420281 /ORGANISM="Proboscia inermis, Strain CCAP1064/1" /LENGTH=33 /DNA_ID= /DNA_START= /DNA_END= /DNA_ORIENTATION=
MTPGFCRAINLYINFASSVASSTFGVDGPGASK